MSLSFPAPGAPAVDPELVRLVSAVVAENLFEVNFNINALQEQLAEVQDRLASLDAAAAPAAGAGAGDEPLRGRVASLERAAAAASRAVEELRASPQGEAKVTPVPQQPVTYYDFWELEEKVRALTSQVATAEISQSMPSAESLLKKFGDVEEEQASIRESCDAVQGQVETLEEQIEHWRIGWAIFALSALNLKESDRRDCLRRLKEEEERLRRAKLGLAPSPEASPGNISRASSWGLPTTRTPRAGITAPPVLNSSRRQVHAQPGPQPQFHT
mmetsp:Transcript_83425/g.226124  ORF Transcript_83425/g.226124 Transcript_83425/m.226124 type:complete len:273 (-) Transcript_83425:371-1189(-)